MTVVRKQLNQFLKMGLIGLIFFSCNEDLDSTNSILNINKGEVRIQFKDTNIKTTQFFSIYEYKNDVELLLDTLSTNNNLITLKAKDYNLLSGMYKLENTSNHQSFRFFYDKKEYTFLETTLDSPEANMSVRLSDTNKMFYEYLQKSTPLYKRAVLLADIITNYPEKNEFLNASKEEYEEVKRSYDFLVQKSKTENLALSYIQLTKPIFPIPQISQEELIYLTRTNFWEQAAPFHPSLLNTNALGNSILTYLSYWKEPKANYEAQEALFKQASENVINAFEQNEPLKNFAISFLVNGFIANGFGQIAEQLKINYQLEDVDCAINTSFSISDTPIDAKSLRFVTSNGKITTLEKLYSPNYKLVFWSAECEHCHRFIENSLNNHTSDSLILISIDNDLELANEYLSKINWVEPSFSIHPYAKESVFIFFQIKATPFIVALNEDYKTVLIN